MVIRAWLKVDEENKESRVLDHRTALEITYREEGQCLTGPDYVAVLRQILERGGPLDKRFFLEKLGGDRNKLLLGAK